MSLLFATHSFYLDRESRLAVQKCLASIITAGASSKTLSATVKAMRQESQKPGIAVANAFVLVEWCSVFMQHLSSSVWEELGNEILLTDAEALDKSVQPGTKSGIVRSAHVVTRRGLRKLFSSPEYRQKAVTGAVTVLTAKASQPTSRNAVILGDIAGVCSRQAPLKPLLTNLKPKYLEFYIREIIGSRTPLPEHVASGLADFFQDFVSTEEVDKDIVPAIEKGLLRAPEVVLAGVLKPLVAALPDSFDLSKTLDSKLLKPLLSNVKSSNPAIRSGAITAFRGIVAKCSDLKTLEHVVEEVANPLATGKLSSADQKILHSEMLEAVPLSPSSAAKVLTATSTASSKEGNETALAAETSALARAGVMVLKDGGEIPKPVVDVIVKGLADKKPGSRRIWLLRCGAILDSSDGSSTTKGQSAFVEAVTPKLIANFQEVIGNSAAAAQNGLVVGAFVLTALLPTLMKTFPDSTISSAIGKASIPSNAISLNAKQSFLLNHRVYGKLTAEDDLHWFGRSLSATVRTMNDDTDSDIALAWAEALIYLLTAPAVPPKVQQETTKSLSQLYIERPELISQFVIDGLWDNLTADKAKDHDLKVDRANLINVLRGICLTPSELEVIGGQVAEEDLESQACSILVLSRQELIPRSSWIDMCLRMGLDPGSLAKKHLDDLLKEIGTRTAIGQNVRETGNLPSLSCQMLQL